MAETPNHAAGTFCWVELGSSDQGASRSFYSALFGWEVEDLPMSETSTYTMFHKGGKYTAALYQVDPKLPNAAPDCWAVHVAVDSTDEAAEKAGSLGGLVLAEPFDVLEAGRVAVLQDPTGAVFSIWQPRDHTGVGLKSEHGALCWNELLTRDTGTAREFYGGLFGWTAHEQEMPPPTGIYTSFLLGEVPAGGMMQIQSDWGEVPTHWATYFSVDDCDSTVQKAVELGATTMGPTMDIPGVGRFAWLADPLGATFAVITLADR
ncbi:MAG: VOC family protein [Gemmatimonadetes bacterium]|nr:VOC family protein [Gemmatimonadota bacterium]NNK47468.1 VOC family protein [Gemmatimonadota bacterium]